MGRDTAKGDREDEEGRAEGHLWPIAPLSGPGLALVLVWSWSGHALVLVWSWSGLCLFLVWSWSGPGVVLVCSWSDPGLALIAVLVLSWSGPCPIPLPRRRMGRDTAKGDREDEEGEGHLWLIAPLSGPGLVWSGLVLVWSCSGSGVALVMVLVLVWPGPCHKPLLDGERERGVWSWSGPGEVPVRFWCGPGLFLVCSWSWSLS